MWTVPPLFAFVIALVGTPLAGALGRRLGFLDKPSELSIHERPVPRSGGLALLTAFGAALAAIWLSGLFAGPDLRPLLGLLLGTIVVAGAGLLDDVRHISPLHKFLWQLIGAAIAVGLGVRLGAIPNPGLAFGFTLLFLVGMANALNLLDGMNGLAAGVAAIAALALAGLGAMRGQAVVWLPALALAGACLGYLPYNFPRAHIFMGDAGSLFLGFSLAGLASLLAQTPGDWPGLLAPMVVLALPLTDTALAMARRFGRFQDLFTGDREHIYDLLSRRGLGDTRAVLVMYALAATAGGLALLVASLPLLPAMVLGLSAWAALAALAAWLGALGSRQSVTLERFRQASRQMFRRYTLAFALDALIVSGGFYVALCLRLSPDIPGGAAELPRYLGSLTGYLPFVLFLYLLVNGFFGLYSRVWRYASAGEALLILAAGTVSMAGVLLADVLMGKTRPIPLSVVVTGGLLSTFGFVATRYRARLLTGLLWRAGIDVDAKRSRTLIVGAGETGQLLAWRMLNQAMAYLPVGFVDDDPDKMGLRLHGLRVLGDRRQIPDLVRALNVDLVVVAIHNLGRQAMGEIVDLCLASEAKVKLLPNILDGLLDDQEGLGGLQELRIEDLLGRPTATVDQEACRQVLQGKVVLVTGAAGSIGAEICRQVLCYEPARLLALDQNETGLYNLALELKPVETVVADVRDVARVESVFRQHKPQVIYHAAAYKHVPLLEQHPSEAFTTNVVGTQVLVKAAIRHGAGRFISVSTDKAVCPRCALGASKRIGEMVVEAAARRQAHPVLERDGGGPVFASVRFGNVLGSQGSVIPTFAWQIEHGQTVTVTDPHMTRFFMTLGEAVALVIQASAYAWGGELFILDMGEPVRVDELARRMIRLRGLRVGKDVKIEYIGPRLGEKLAEKLWCEVHERPALTSHASITCIHSNNHSDFSRLERQIEQMEALLREGREAEMCARLYALALDTCEQCTENPLLTAGSHCQSLTVAANYGLPERVMAH